MDAWESDDIFMRQNRIKCLALALLLCLSGCGGGGGDSEGPSTVHAAPGGGKTEAETYAEYCAYVEEWAEYANDGGQDQGTSPLTYEEWKEENAERVEAE